MALKILSTCPLYTISGCGKREAHTLKMVHGDAKASTRCLKKNLAGTALRTSGLVPAYSRQ